MKLELSYNEILTIKRGLSRVLIARSYDDNDANSYTKEYRDITNVLLSIGRQTEPKSQTIECIENMDNEVVEYILEVMRGIHKKSGTESRDYDLSRRVLLTIQEDNK